MNNVLTSAEVMHLLATVQDPEIGLSITDLGLVYRLEVTDARIDLELIFTAQACPLRQLIVQWVRDVLEAHAAQPVHLAVEEDVPWTPDRLTPDGRAALGYRS